MTDPLGGSWFVESLTDRIEDEAEKYFKEIESMGGVISAIEKGYFQYEISRSASAHQKKIDSNELIHVGVNDFTKPDEKIDIPILEIGRDVEERQNKKIEELRKSRDAEYVKKTLSKVEDSCRNGDNLLPSIIGAVKAGATMGEIVIIMKNEFGEWNETSVF